VRTISHQQKLKTGTVKKILNDLRLRIYGGGGQDNFRIKCPNPMHEDKEPSCYINKENGLWFCHGCHANNIFGGKGNLYVLFKIFGRDDLVALYCPHGEDIDIKEWLKSKINNIPERKIVDTKKKRARLPKEFVNLSSSTNHAKQGVLQGKYLKKMRLRGLRRATIRSFGMGFIHEHPIYARRVVVPIYEKSRLVGFQTRSIKKKMTRRKYLFNLGFDSKIYWFNIDNIKGGEVIIVEGVFEAMMLWQWGYQAVAVFGLNLTPEKVLKLMKKGVTSIVFALDGDGPAKSAVKSMYFEVVPQFDDVYIIKMPKGRDVDDMAKKEFRSYYRERRRIRQSQFGRKI